MVKSTNETLAAGLAAAPAPPAVLPVPLARLGGVLAAGTLFAYGGVFLWLCVRHVCYPGFMEPMEGDVLQHIERLANGQPAYPAPTGEFIPLPYMPLYYFAAVPLYWIFRRQLRGTAAVVQRVCPRDGRVGGLDGLARNRAREASACWPRRCTLRATASWTPG